MELHLHNCFHGVMLKWRHLYLLSGTWVVLFQAICWIIKKTKISAFHMDFSFSILIPGSYENVLKFHLMT